MESFQLPVSAIVSIVACLFAVAVTLVNPYSSHEPGMYHSASREAYYSTSAERLLRRFLSDESEGYEALCAAMRSLYADKADEELLKTVSEAIPREPDNELRGKLYTLKGISLKKSGSREAAIESFKVALNLDPLNKTASEALNTLYGVGGGRSPDDPSGDATPDK